MQRGSFGEERYEKIEFQRVVQEKFQLLKQNTSKGGPPWYILDARKSKEELHEEIKLIVLNVIETVKDKALSKMWL